MPGPTDGSRGRDLELALFERIEERLDSINDGLRDVRERVIRIEAQDVTGRINMLEGRVVTLEKWQSRVMGQVALIIVPVAAAAGALMKFMIDVLTHH